MCIDLTVGQYGWQGWGSCSKTCGTGTMRRRRHCNRNYCIGGAEVQEKDCYMAPCQTTSKLNMLLHAFLYKHDQKTCQFYF